MLQKRVANRISAGFVVFAALTLSGHPAFASGSGEERTHTVGVIPATFKKQWKWDDFYIWATDQGTCLALEQDTEHENGYHVWGWEQSPGSRLTMYFGGIEDARPQTVQMSWNDGGEFPYDAEVRSFRDWDVYAISIQANALSVFPRQLTVTAHVDGKLVFLNVYNSIDRLRNHMAECLAYQQAN